MRSQVLPSWRPGEMGMKGESHLVLAPLLLPISASSAATQALACSPKAWVQCSAHVALVRSYLCWFLCSRGAQRCFVTKSVLLWVWCIEVGKSVTWERDLLQSISITLHRWQCGLFLITCILWDPRSTVFLTWGLWWDRAVHAARKGPV